MQTDRLNQQMQFIVEIDRLKQILRQSLITNGSRRENSAEHSWHLAIMASVLTEYALPGADLLRTLQMLLLHDLVEIDAGDTFCYDLQANQDKAEREAQAADRIFGLLPSDLGQEMRSLWDEFEARETPSAKFAAALDRIEPMLLNQHTQGGTWKQHGITQDRVLQRMQPVAEGAPELWGFVEQVIEDCVAAGYLQAGAIA
ncbi:MAG: HD domain-containing protein [Oscillatoriophycideae cyanobacterium NC_groundwater_1537_Pr4_S-0.65um_50_18]|nr:HD domain-containing protein [Oscillatoriophycideae cyanobacterium NC_groundwater_1537_Pr4_S-0.65um_50_18]